MSAIAGIDAFPIAKKWPARHPDRIQLYSINSPNGVKASIMLEETGLPYEPHLVRFDAADQKSPEFRSLNPYAKIPAIIDPDGPGGRPLPLFESGAILAYLADKSGRFLPRDGGARYETIQWLMFQVANINPMFGQVGFFHRFEGRAWLMGDEYTIADIATFPLVRNLIGYYGAGGLVGIEDFTNVGRSLEAFVARPAVARGLRIPARD